MESFLKNIVGRLVTENKSLDELVLILPSNRAVRECHSILSTLKKETFFAPKVLTIEAFIASIAKMQLADDAIVLLELFKIYSEQQSEKHDSFETFSAWGNQLLNDFNEIDRYLINPEEIFGHLFQIARINAWGKEQARTSLINSYLDFSKSLFSLYKKLNQILQNKGLGYQGALYRKANDLCHDYLRKNGHKKHYFIGLNALNAVESSIITSLLELNKTKVFWDLDPHFCNNPVHDAAHFIRKYQRLWHDRFRDSLYLTTESSFLNQKNIEITGAPKNQLQCKYAALLLRHLDLTQEKTAIVLADENQLPILLNSLHIRLEEVNITMGYPLSASTVTKFALSALRFFATFKDNGWQSKEIFSFFTHMGTLSFFDDEPLHDILEVIRNDRLEFVSLPLLNKQFITSSPLKYLITSIRSSEEMLLSLSKVIEQFLHNAVFHSNPLEKGAAVQILAIIKKVIPILQDYPFLKNGRSLLHYVENLISKESITLKGNPNKGLQIMGLLETRGLDFDNVIITSLNEGVLPAGKTTGSFIPFDVKQYFKLPTVKEKDAVYTYHFYRLIQRAKNVHLIYNTEADVLKGGEKSRYILQLESDPKLAPFLKKRSATIAASSNSPHKKTVAKTPLLMASLHAYAEKGFSPSALSTFIKDPYTFYKRYILKIDEPLTLDTEVPYNILGTIVHDSLEELYKPFVGISLTTDLLNETKKKIASQVLYQFGKYYSKQSILRGKKRILLNVIEKYILSIITLDLDTSKKSDLKILGLEETFNMNLDGFNISSTVKLRGKLDRIDNINGKLRILDYKTGYVDKSGLNLGAMGSLFESAKYDKAFQLLCYALMATSKHDTLIDEAAIIPIRNMTQAPLRLYFKTEKSFQISHSKLAEFEIGLRKLIEEIFNPDIPFTAT